MPDGIIQIIRKTNHPSGYWNIRKETPMPVTSKEISAYSVSVISEDDPNKLAATVTLLDASGKEIAFLGFYQPGITMAPNEYRTDLNSAIASYPFSSLAAIVDVLRNEKPVSFYW